jgi:1-acyl-sn-glycerol-3-phosphate acyltransferase
MRTLMVLVTLLVATPPLALVVIVAGLFGVRDRPNGVYQKMAHLWARLVCGAAGVRVELRGQLNDGPAVYCANHVSWFDVLTMAAVIPNYTFISKRELADIPIFGRAARTVGIIFIDRANRKDAFAQYEAAAVQVRGGKNVVVFPEGTRGFEYRLRPFKKGPFVLAISAGVPVVPTVVYGAREVQRKGRAGIRSGAVTIHFLEPAPTAGMNYEQREEVMETVWRRMADLLRREYGVESAGGPLSEDPEARALPTSFF